MVQQWRPSADEFWLSFTSLLNPLIPKHLLVFLWEVWSIRPERQRSFSLHQSCSRIWQVSRLGNSSLGSKGPRHFCLAKATHTYLKKFSRLPPAGWWFFGWSGSLQRLPKTAVLRTTCTSAETRSLVTGTNVSNIVESYRAASKSGTGQTSSRLWPSSTQNWLRKGGMAASGASLAARTNSFH